MRLIWTHFPQLSALFPDSVVENKNAPPPSVTFRSAVYVWCLSATHQRISGISVDGIMFLLCLHAVAQLGDGCTIPDSSRAMLSSVSLAITGLPLLKELAQPKVA